MASINTLITAFADKSKMPLEKILESVEFNIKKQIAKREPEYPFGKEFENNNNVKNSNEKIIKEVKENG